MNKRKMIYLDDAIRTVERFYKVNEDMRRNMAFELRQLPSAQPDLSGYSDRLWETAYDHGYERCRQDAIDACLDGWNKGYEEILVDIRALQSAQPEPPEDRRG